MNQLCRCSLYSCFSGLRKMQAITVCSVAGRMWLDLCQWTPSVQCSHSWESTAHCAKPHDPFYSASPKKKVFSHLLLDCSLICSNCNTVVAFTISANCKLLSFVFLRKNKTKSELDSCTLSHLTYVILVFLFIATSLWSLLLACFIA